MVASRVRCACAALSLLGLALAGCNDVVVVGDEDPVEPRSLNDGLLLRWTFEDRIGNQILDLSGHHRHGDLRGGGTFTEGLIGDAVRLDGIDHYIAFDGPRSISLYGGAGGSFTISARVRLPDLSRYNTLCVGCGPFNSMYLGSTNQGNRALAAVYTGVGTVAWPSSTPSLEEDTWVEVTMLVESGVGTRFYRRGVGFVRERLPEERVVRLVDHEPLRS